MAENVPVPKDLAEGIRRVVDRLNTLHKNMRDVEQRIIAVEKSAESVQLPRVHLAARDAFLKISASGSKLVECHVSLGRILSPPKDDSSSGGRPHG